MRALRMCFYLSLQCIMCWRKVWTFWKFLSIDRVFLFQNCAFIGKRTCWALATFYNFTSLVDALVTRRQYSGALRKIIMIFILLKGAPPPLLSLSSSSSPCHHLVIIITRPKPAYGQQGLAGSWGQNTDQAGTFWGVLNVSLCVSGAQLGYKPTWNHEKP